MNTDFNPYIVLGVNKDASIDDIKKSFKQKSKTLHPDHGGLPDDFDILKKAYEILTEASRRRMWDEYRLSDNLDIENEAKMVASQIAVQNLDTYPDICNFDKEMAEVFEKCLQDIAGQIRDCAQRKVRLEKWFNAIHKKPVDDFISIDIERAIDAKDIQIRQQKLNLEIHKKAFGLIKGYKFDTDRLSDF
ncbi:MAG: J domain-containing protein [Bacteroidales bacterium]|jgi:curved DNA-binding protein CbpA|nr:J domain-containing protein [Bacteroidales bacterium]